MARGATEIIWRRVFVGLELARRLNDGVPRERRTTFEEFRLTHRLEPPPVSPDFSTPARRWRWPRWKSPSMSVFKCLDVRIPSRHGRGDGQDERFVNRAHTFLLVTAESCSIRRQAGRSKGHTDLALFSRSEDDFGNAASTARAETCAPFLVRTWSISPLAPFPGCEL